MTQSSPLSRLGLSADDLTDEQIAVIDSLSSDDLTLLVRIKKRLDDASGDVEGHELSAGGVVW